jgi:hypothetical protein
MMGQLHSQKLHKAKIEGEKNARARGHNIPLPVIYLRVPYRVRGRRPGNNHTDPLLR